MSLDRKSVDSQEQRRVKTRDGFNKIAVVIPRLGDPKVMVQKRKAAASSSDSPRKRVRPEQHDNAVAGYEGNHEADHNGQQTPTKKTRSGRPIKLSQKLRAADEEAHALQERDDRSGSPTPRANGISIASTPKKEQTPKPTPSRAKRADLSAKRKSARALAEVQDEDDWEGQGALAHAILDDEDDHDIDDGANIEDGVEEANATTSPSATPSKRGRGRPKQAPRSPTPDGDLAPEERYFFQNRPGLPKISSNTMSSVKFLSHDEYFEQLRSYEDPHASEKSYLMRLHARSFPQWKFELHEGFNLCLYGYGSKRKLANKFAEWLYSKTQPRPRIVVVNGYTSKCSIKVVLNTIATAVADEDADLKLTGQPQEMLEKLLAYMDTQGPEKRILLLVNSIDAPSLRRSNVQSILARLSEHPAINLVTTADTPTFLIMWNPPLRDQFRFIFHDCTTFEAYDAEINAVDGVHDLLGRKGRRIGGKEGVGFVLKSLPENARNLYRVLLTEVLVILSDGVGGLEEIGEEDNDEPTRKKMSREVLEDLGVEYRALYQKASEEFICSSDMNFRFLLKEFHDHQMITSRRDASGTELLSVPLSKEEMEAVLEDLVLD